MKSPNQKQVVQFISTGKWDGIQLNTNSIYHELGISRRETYLTKQSYRRINNLYLDFSEIN